MSENWRIEAHSAAASRASMALPEQSVGKPKTRFNGAVILEGDYICPNGVPPVLIGGFDDGFDDLPAFAASYGTPDPLLDIPGQCVTNLFSKEITNSTGFPSNNPRSVLLHAVQSITTAISYRLFFTKPHVHGISSLLGH